MWETGSKPAKTNNVSGPSPVSSTHRFFCADPPTQSPMGQKMSTINFKHKITTSANYTDGIGTGYTSHDKDLWLHGKRLKNYFEINQSDYTKDWCRDETYGGGGVKKWVFLSPKKKLGSIGTDGKRGKQVGFSTKEYCSRYNCIQSAIHLHLQIL